MQGYFGLVGCIYQNRYVIGVFGVGNCFFGVPSAAFLFQLGLHVNAHKTEYMCLIKQATFPHLTDAL